MQLHAAVALRKPTYAELEVRVAELERRLSLAFSVEEMDVLREQLAERASRAEADYETLEWRVRAELQHVRDAEAHCDTAAREMRHATRSITTLFEDDDESTEVHTPMHRMLQ